MRKIKETLIILAAGAAGGLIGAVFILPILVRTHFLNMPMISSPIATPQPQANISNTTEKQPVSYQPNYFSEAIGKIQSSVVAIQSFSGGILIRHGSGMVLTQDGLLATLNSIVPANANIVQVISNGKIYKAKVVSRDYKNNIAILAISVDGNPQVVRLSSEMPNLGQKLLVFGETISFSQENPLISEVLIQQSDNTLGRFRISLDYDPDFYGSILADDGGTVFGLIDFINQKPVIIYSKSIENILNNYLTVHNK